MEQNAIYELERKVGQARSLLRDAHRALNEEVLEAAKAPGTLVNRQKLTAMREMLCDLNDAHAKSERAERRLEAYRVLRI